MQFSKLITFCTVCRRYAALRAVCWLIVCIKMCPLRAQKLLFASRSGTPFWPQAKQALPRPRSAPNRNDSHSHCPESPAHRPRNVSSAHIGSGEGARRQPPRQHCATIAPPSRHHRAPKCYCYCYRVTLPKVTLCYFQEHCA